MKNTLNGLLLAGACLIAGACVVARGGGERRIYRVAGCDSRLGEPRKREDCRACVTRPRPHVFLPDRPEGERCVPR